MALTKVSGGILDPGINVAGIVTATGFDGPFTGGSSKNITAGVVTATSLDLNGNGDISGNLVIGGNLTANGDFTTLNTTLREVEILRVDADTTAIAGIITQSGSGHALYVDGTTILGNSQYVPTFDAGTQLAVAQLSGNSNSVDMTILGGRAGKSMIRFGDHDSNNRGSIQYHHTDESIKFYNNGEGVTPKLTITNDGKVGINSTIPDTLLHVYGSYATQKLITLAGGGSKRNNYIGIVNSDNLEIGADEDNEGGDSSIRFRIDGSEKVRIASNGRVGIGTDNPTHKLEVDGNALLKDNLTVSGISTFTGNINANGNLFIPEYIQHSGDIDSRFGFSGTDTFAIDTAGSERLEINSSGTGRFKGGAFLLTNGRLNVNYDAAHSSTYYLDNDAQILVSNGDSAGTKKSVLKLGGEAALVYGGGSSSLIIADRQNERLRIDSNGRILIGHATTPAAVASVAVVGSYGASSNLTPFVYLCRDEDATSITNNESLGQILFASKDGYRGAVIEAKAAGTWSGSSSDGYLVFKTTPDNATVPTEKLRITSNGNVSIGNNATPDTLLHLQGDTPKLRIESTNALSDSAGTEEIARIEFEATKSSNQNVAASMRVRQDGTWSTVDDWFSPTAIEFYTQDQSGTEVTTPRFTIGSTGLATLSSEIATAQDYPTFQPALDFNFAAEKKLDPRITYQRTGPASFTDKFGKVVLVGNNVPRFDHDPITGECKGLLIEQNKTNYVRVSTNLASEWVSGSGSFAVDNAITNPDGSVGAYYHTGGELYHQNINLSGANTNTITVSLWVKERSGQSGNLDIEIFQQITGSAISMGVWSFNPATEVISTAPSTYSDGKVVKYPNGWYRVSAKATTASGNFSSSTRFDMQSAEHYVWGMQIETGSFPTSFIPTKGSTASRGQDLVEITEEEFVEFYNQTEGSIVSEFMLPPSWPMSGYASITLTLSDNSYNNRITLASSTGSAAINADVAISGSTTRASLGSYTSGAYSIKAAMAYKASDSAGSLNGRAAVTTSPGTLPLLTRADIGKDHNNGNALNGHIKRLMYYSKRLPNSQLVTLTS